MKIKMSDNSTAIIEGVKHFDLTHTFMCGQCFRWYQSSEDTYTGVAYGKAVKMSLKGDTLTIYNTSLWDVENIWMDYLDLDRDYSQIKALYSNDIYLSKAMKFGYGIHILNQEIFECLISFIISTQNQIPRIKKIVSGLSSMYGDKVLLDGEELYTFPTIDRLCGIEAGDLSSLNAGYRAGYIADAVSKTSSGEVCLDEIMNMSYTEARNELMKIRGVGPKVADCVLLFSAKKSCAFPVDVWVQRTMRTLYLDPKATNKEIERKAAELFGEYAGFAQQYLFYYARENGGF